MSLYKYVLIDWMTGNFASISTSLTRYSDRLASWMFLEPVSGTAEFLCSSNQWIYNSDRLSSTHVHQQWTSQSKTHDTRTRNACEKLVRVSYRLAARYFSREFLASNTLCFSVERVLIRASFSYEFLVRVSRTSFSYEFLVRLAWALQILTLEERQTEA